MSPNHKPLPLAVELAEAIALYVTGEASPEDRVRVRKAIASDPEIAALVAALQRDGLILPVRRGRRIWVPIGVGLAASALLAAGALFWTRPERLDVGPLRGGQANVLPEPASPATDPQSRQRSIDLADDAVRRAEASFAQGQPRDAEQATLALEVLREGLGEDSRIHDLERLRARALIELGRLDEAEALLRPIAVRSPDLDAALAFCELIRGQFAAAAGRFEAASTRAEGTIAVRCRLGIAASALRGGDVAGARSSIEAAERLAAGDPRTTGPLLMARGWLALATNKPETASTHFREAMNRFETAFGPDHATTARARLALGRARIASSRPEEAGPLLTSALSALRRALGKDHWDVAACSESLAQVERATGKPVPAELKLRLALDIRGNRGGPDPAEIQATARLLASWLRQDGQFEDAEELERQAGTPPPLEPAPLIPGSAWMPSLASQE